MKQGRLIAAFILLTYATFFAAIMAHAQTANNVVVNRKGSSGASISITTGAAVELLTGSTQRYFYCVKCTVPVNCTWTDPSTGDLGPAVTPSSSVGYPIAANTDYCEDARTFGYLSLKSRLDCISTSGSGTCSTLEEQ